jgi:hypothetical protein
MSGVKGKTGVYQHKPNTKDHNIKIGLSLLGIKRSEESKLNYSKSKLGDKNPAYGKKAWNSGKEFLQIKGDKNYNWKGGISKLKIYKHYKNFEYINWRKQVFERDGWTCQKCGNKGVMLHPHHIKGYTEYPEARYVVDNGITLCVPCHHQTHWGH